MQSDWRWCKKCQGLAFSLNQPSVCPAGASHDHSQSGNYTLAVDDPLAQGQSDWRWCKKCQGLAFSLNQPSVCPAGGSHDHSQSGNYTIAVDDPSAQGQPGWQWCRKCQGLAFSLNQPSVCPAGGSHDHSQSGNYTLPSTNLDVAESAAPAAVDFADPDFILNEAVGEGCANTPRDVLVLQRLLSSIPNDRGGPQTSLPLSGLADSDTLGSIKRFQSFMNFPPTGAVAPLDPTHVALIQSILGMGCKVFGRDKDGVVDAVLDSPHSSPRWAYFFKGNRYIRYSVDHDIAQPYHERMIGRYWKPLPFDTVDAALWYPPKQKAYFFKGDKYVRYTLSPEGVDFPPKDISPSWGKLWEEDIDAALWWPDDPNSALTASDQGVAYFFKQDEYVKFDPRLGSDGDVAPGYPKKIGAGWPRIWPDRIDSAIWWPSTRSAYFFRGDSYIKWDRMNLGLGPDGGVPHDYPYPIRAHWEGLDQFSVFAAHTLLAPCNDARPGGRPPTEEYDHGEIVDGQSAQAGWDLGINFESLEDLVEKLVDNPVQLPEHKGPGRIVKNHITRLGMVAHGDNDQWEVQNHTQNGETLLTMVTLPKYERLFQRLGEALTQKAVVIFLGCNIAGFVPTLLQQISRLLPGRLIVGFRSKQHVGAPLISRSRDALGCDECGVKDTPYFGTGEAQAHLQDWPKWPWSSEYSPSAVLVRDGIIIPSVP